MQVKKIVSSANIIGSKIFDVFGKSLMYIRNIKGLSIEQYGTMHVILSKGCTFVAAVTNTLFTGTKIALKSS